METKIKTWLKLIESKIDELSPDELNFVKAIIQELQETGQSSKLFAIWNRDYERRPVSIEQFLNDDYYVGKEGKSLWPKNKELLYDVFNPASHYVEVILTGSIGWGKSTVAVIGMAYDIYRMSCLRSPQTFYELGTSSNIVYGVYNVVKSKAKGAAFAKLKNLLDESPFFKEEFPRNLDRNSEIDLPKNMAVKFGSQDLHALSEDLFSIILDELNFMRGAEQGQAYKLYTSTRRRVASRYAIFGRILGRMWLISSKQDTTDFLDKHINDQMNNPEVKIADQCEYKIKPAHTYSGNYFYVLIGRESERSKIFEDLTEEEVKSYDKLGFIVEKVPLMYYNDFKENLEDSIRDICGIATYGSRPWIAFREKIFECAIDCPTEHPFTKSSIILDFRNPLDIADDIFDYKVVSKIEFSMRRPKLNPNSYRYIHVDLGLTGDSAGIAMAHVSPGNMKTVKVRYGGEVRMYTTGIIVDFMMKFDPPTASEIDISAIIKFIIDVQKYGYQLGQVSWDGFQSRQGIQELIKSGVNAKLQSVERSVEPYEMLRAVILAGAIKYYKYEPFLDEAVYLQKGEKGKVDHLKGKSKDVSDAVCGAVYACMTNKMEIKIAQAAPDMLVKSVSDLPSSLRDAIKHDHLIDPEEEGYDEFIGVME